MKRLFFLLITGVLSSSLLLAQNVFNNENKTVNEEVFLSNQSNIQVSLIKDLNAVENVFSIKFTNLNDKVVEFEYTIVNELTGELYYSCSSVILSQGLTYIANDGTLVPEVFNDDLPFVSNGSMLTIAMNQIEEINNYSINVTPK